MRWLCGSVVVLFLATSPACATDCDLGAPDATSAGIGCARSWMDHNLYLNDIVTVGTHNSYKEAIPEKIMALVRMGARKAADGLDYSHIPLTDQLNDGARAIEIDVVYDPAGGLYAHPAGAAMTGYELPAGFVETMSKPGFKVLHVQDIDFRAVCMTLVACLRELKAWSNAHPEFMILQVVLPGSHSGSTEP